MQLPFTAEQFFDLFVRYNNATWPAPWWLSALAVLAVALAVSGRPVTGRVAGGILAALWLWMGVVYHMMFFSDINPAAWVFGALFIVAAGLLAWAGVGKGQLALGPPRGATGIAGVILVMYGLIGYPLLGYLVGHRYPAVPTFGAPCPTTIFTLGLLLWSRRPVPWSVVIVPLAWALVGTSAAIQLGVPQDYGLPIAAIVATPLLWAGRRPRSRASVRPRHLLHSASGGGA